jgi:hypothetical protein
MKNYFIYIILGTILLSAYSCRKSDYVLPVGNEIISDEGVGVGTVTWDKDMDITIEGFVFVNEGQTLTIEAGSVIKFKEGQGATASALIVARGGKILANGTKDEPIIFTSELDDLDGSLAVDTSGLWGGIIILGDAPLNTSTGESFVEGIPISEPRALFGGNNESDNSGVLSYVSIRYAGTFLHEENEINGLTLGGVGNETTVEYVEVINSADDGIEVFGGTVNLDHIVVYNAGDDAFDFDLGYQGKMQFVLGLQNGEVGDNMIEISGSDNSSTRLPISKPEIANCTFISNALLGNSNCVYLDEFGAGLIVNSIFDANKNGVIAEYVDGKTDSYSQWGREQLIIESNVFNNVANNVSDSVFMLSGLSVDPDEALNWSKYFGSGNSEIIDLEIGISSGEIVLIPNASTNNNLYILDDSWFDITNYKGSFGTFDWTEGWTNYKNML